MLYASTARPNLSIVKVTLSSISSKHKIPATLRDRFVKIVLDAMRIQADPNNIPRSMDRESIDLAIQLLTNDPLKRSLADIHEKKDVDQITPKKAENALKAMGYASAH